MTAPTYLDRLIAERDQLIAATQEPILHGQSYSAGGRTYTLVQWDAMIKRLDELEKRIAIMQARGATTPLFYGIKGVKFE